VLLLFFKLPETLLFVGIPGIIASYPIATIGGTLSGFFA
jgi:hypothetical protein